jgi:hypothetical protein
MYRDNSEIAGGGAGNYFSSILILAPQAKLNNIKTITL